ncbi:hypothetical protein BSL78_19880 [Apostichopus japonicus]|uniref:Uncharacterized protein n=1 Tax=Stichopus japonicus TaxID=307972 RepID=A0A2G8K5I7_STIJA|nr:hypothetical protein BSL78_19880 [Apostichopus japonicus]
MITDTPASPVTDVTVGSTVSGVTPVSSVSTDTSASPVTDGTTGATGSGATPASPVSGFKKRPAAFLAPTLTILAVVLLIVTIVIGIIVFRWYLRRKKSDPGATAGDAEVGAYEVPKKTSFSALEITGNVTDSDEDSNQVDVEYAISNEEMERESDSYDDVENGNKPGIKGSEMDCEVMDIGKATLDKCDLGNSIIRDRGPLPIIDISQTGRSLDVDECYQELPGTEESNDVVECRVKIKDLPKQLQDKNSVPEDTITDEFKVCLLLVSLMNLGVLIITDEFKAKLPGASTPGTQPGLCPWTPPWAPWTAPLTVSRCMLTDAFSVSIVSPTKFSDFFYLRLIPDEIMEQISICPAKLRKSKSLGAVLSQNPPPTPSP